MYLKFLNPREEYLDKVSVFYWVNLFSLKWNVTEKDDDFAAAKFSRQEYWTGLPFPPPGNLPNSGTETRSAALQADSLLPQPLGKP